MMPRYEKYKDSGIEWVGEIPEHWELKRLKDVICEPLRYGANESADSFDENLPRYIRITDFGENGELRNDTFRSIPEDIANGYLLKEGDILFARSGATVGKTFQFKEYKGKSCFAGYLIKASPNLTRIFSDYLFYFTQSDAYQGWKNSIFIQATIQNISAEKYSVFKICLPDLSEQATITSYLDERTAKLDKLIKNKAEQIEKLREIRQIEINTAVTKGLNPDAKMKPSGIEWLGDIPDHWKMDRIKNIAALSNEKIFDYGEDEHLIALENIESWTGRHIDTNVDFEGGGIRFEDNDILFGKLRPYLAKVLHSKKRGVCVSEILAIRPDKRIDSRFLFYRMLSADFIKVINSSTYGAKMPRANWQFISNLKMPYPEYAQQKGISDYLDKRFSEITKLIDNITLQVEKLKEIRKIEIFNAVTGKIKVV